MIKHFLIFIFGYNLKEIEKAVAYHEFMPGMSGHGKLIRFFALARSANSPTMGQIWDLGYDSVFNRNGYYKTKDYWPYRKLKYLCSNCKGHSSIKGQCPVCNGNGLSIENIESEDERSYEYHPHRIKVAYKIVNGVRSNIFGFEMIRLQSDNPGEYIYREKDGICDIRKIGWARITTKE